MNEVNKTLFIPLYGKSFVSKKGIILNDPYAEDIWEKEKFKIKRKSKSKWLAYYMAMRARVFDDWTIEKIKEIDNPLVLHIGCGLDSRYQRVSAKLNEQELSWFDLDFEDVIKTRKKYFKETNQYKMIPFNMANANDINSLPSSKNVVIILEGISMYLTNKELISFFNLINKKYLNVYILMDVYTTFGVKMSKIKNPVKDVGVNKVYGLDDPFLLVSHNDISFSKEHLITPKELVNELKGFDKSFFKIFFTGKLSRKLYRLFEYRKESPQN